MSTEILIKDEGLNKGYGSGTGGEGLVREVVGKQHWQGLINGLNVGSKPQVYACGD